MLGSILRRPTLATLLRHYAAGDIDFEGGDLLTFVELARRKKIKFKGRALRKGFLLKRALPLLLTREDKVHLAHDYAGDETGRRRNPSASSITGKSISSSSPPRARSRRSPGCWRLPGLESRPRRAERRRLMPAPPSGEPVFHD